MKSENTIAEAISSTKQCKLNPILNHVSHDPYGSEKVSSRVKALNSSSKPSHRASEQEEELALVRKILLSDPKEKVETRFETTMKVHREGLDKVFLNDEIDI